MLALICKGRPRAAHSGCRATAKCCRKRLSRERVRVLACGRPIGCGTLRRLGRSRRGGHREYRHVTRGLRRDVDAVVYLDGRDAWNRRGRVGLTEDRPYGACGVVDAHRGADAQIAAQLGAAHGDDLIEFTRRLDRKIAGDDVGTRLYLGEHIRCVVCKSERARDAELLRAAAGLNKYEVLEIFLRVHLKLLALGRGDLGTALNLCGGGVIKLLDEGRAAHAALRIAVAHRVEER